MLTIVLGTRPEIIKCAPIVHEAQRRGIPVSIIHTGQHYTRALDEQFFQELNVPAPVINLHVGSLPAAEQIGLMIERLSAAFLDVKPSVMIVQGDTNSVLAGALCAYKMGIPVAHLEAGLRCDDWTMPEEMNRVLTDRLSRWLFCPTEIQRTRLKQEGIDHDGVTVVGNSIVDAVLHYADVAKGKSSILSRQALEEDQYILLTMHRPGNVDDADHLRALIHAIGEAANRLNVRVVFPIHPRTKAMLDKHRIVLHPAYIEMEPLGYFDLLRLQQGAKLILTDSGGIQEEACILRVPTIILRANTERPEVLDVGAGALYSGTDANALFDLMKKQSMPARNWANPFGDGHTASHVLDALSSCL